MVAVKGAHEAYLKAPPKGIGAILLYGTDAGLVSERAAALAKTVAAQTDPPGEILRIDESDLEASPDKLTLELGTVAMFGGRKVVRTQQSRRVTAATVRELIEGGRLEGFLIVEAGALRAEDAMRKLFEAADGAAAIPCHADAAADLDALVRDVLGRHGLEISADAKRLLVSRLGADRALSRGEVEKLALYADGKGRVEEADVEAIVGDAAETAIDRIVSATLAGQTSAALTEFDRAISAGESAQYVMIATERMLHRLHRVRMAIETGANMDEALKALRPPLFFKQRDGFVRLVESWSALKLARGLLRIAEVQRLSRRGGASAILDEVVLIESLLFDLARLAAWNPRGGR